MQYLTEAQRTFCDDTCVRVDHSSYAARPAPIGSRVLVRLFERRIEIRKASADPARRHLRRAVRALCRTASHLPTTGACKHAPQQD